LPRRPKPLKATQPADTACRSLLVCRIVAGMLTVLMLVLLGRVVQLQVAPSEDVLAWVGTKSTPQTVMARRGAILDRQGRTIASSRIAYQLFIDQMLIRPEDRPTFADQVAHELGYDPVEIEKALFARPDSRFIVIDKRLSEAQMDRIHALDIDGLAIDPYLVREYPQGSLAGQLLGFVGTEGRGLEGIELQLNEQLTATPGTILATRDARARRIFIGPSQYQQHQDGQSVSLSIDLTIQDIAQQALAEAVEKYNAESGQLIVMDPWTGEILALALVPTFKPADFIKSEAEDRRNRAVTDVFEPGSIFKPFVYAGLIAKGVVAPTDILDTTEAGYYVSPKGRALRDTSGHGEISFEDVLVYSSNIGMFIAAQETSLKSLHGIVQDFGFGQLTGSGLAGEIPGLVNPLHRWNHYSQSSIPMGQEIAVTAMQITRAFAAIASDGAMPTPTIQAIAPEDVGVSVIRQRVITPSIAQHTREVLRRVVIEGTGRRANSELYPIFGKTGTAQLPNAEQGGYHQDQYVSSFMGGAPMDQPRLIVGCFIYKPDKSIGHYGGTVAGPAAKKVLEDSLLYLDIAPSLTDPHQQAAR